MTRIGDGLQEGAQQLQLHQLCHASPRLEAELLLSEALGVSRSYLFAWAEREIEPEAYQRYRSLLERRGRGEPIAYILGQQEFWSLELRVTPATLIPRPETELLVERALRLLPADGPIKLAELGTGSGAVAAAVASERPHWNIVATESSPEALAVAQGNFQRLGLCHIEVVLGNWLQPLRGSRFDCILSNPPYVAATDPHLHQGDVRFEPPRALRAGPKGLDAIQRIASDAERHLIGAGLLLLEHGYDQGNAVRGILHQQGYLQVKTWRDLEGRERVSGGKRYST